MQGHLGEVVFVELPEPGATVTAGGSFGNVESVKATSDVNSPISGEVVEVNSKLSETPGLVRTRLPSVYNTFPIVACFFRLWKKISALITHM